MTTLISAFPQFTALGAATRTEYEAAVAGIGVVLNLAYPTLRVAVDRGDSSLPAAGPRWCCATPRPARTGR